MASITDLLASYSKEVAALEPDVSENMVAEDDLLEQIVAEVSDDDDPAGAVLEEEVVAIESSISALCDSMHSLESSVALLGELKDSGADISETTMRLFNSSIVESLEARGIPSDLFGSEVVFSSESTSSSDQDKQEGLFRRIWNMIVRAFQRLREWISRFVGWFNTSTHAVASSAKKIRERAQQYRKEGRTSGDRKIRVQPFEDLWISGKLDSKTTMDALYATSKKVMVSANSILNEANTVAEGLRKKTGVEYLRSLYKKVRDHVVSIGEGLQPFSSSLPGNRTLSIEFTERGDKFQAAFKILHHGEFSVSKDGWGAPQTLDSIIASSDRTLELVEDTVKQVDIYKKRATLINVEALMQDPGVADAKSTRGLASSISQSIVVSEMMVSSIIRTLMPIAKRVQIMNAISLRQYK